MTKILVFVMCFFLTINTFLKKCIKLNITSSLWRVVSRLSDSHRI